MKRQKIILYNPKAVFYTMPLALLAIASNIDSQKYDVIIIDGRIENDPINAVLSHVDEGLCVGITALTGGPIRDALKISRAVKARNPGLPVVWGGWHSSLFPTQTLADEPGIDITVQGQGEVTFREIVECLSEGESLQNVLGIAFRENGEIIQNPPRPLRDVNKLPEVTYEIVEVEKYFQLKNRRQFDYITSTGCFFRCAFCADPFVYNRKWTALSPERIGEEIERHYHRYHFRDLDFQDETFFTHRKRVTAIAEEFLCRGINITWAGTMRADQGSRMDDAEFALCAVSGLRRVLIGVESGSQEMMDWMRKDIKLEQVFECAEKCLRHNVAAIFPFIVGFPGESESSVTATLKVARELRSMHPHFDTPIFYFKPYPGSEITHDVVRNGFQLPQNIEEWANFDYVGSSGPWVTHKKFQLIERFKFYNRIAGGKNHWYERPLRRLAKWRCDHGFYQMPLEKMLIEKLKPLPRLS